MVTGKEVFYKMENTSAGFTYSVLSLPLREDYWYMTATPSDTYDFFDFYSKLLHLHIIYF